MEQKEFDEFDAVEYIRSHVAKDLSEKYDDDDLLLLIDAIGDFLSAHELDNSDNDAAGMAVVKYVKSQLKKDADNAIAVADVEPLVLAELDYENSLE